MSELNPLSVLFEVIDHHLKAEQLEVSREQLQVARAQLLLAYNRDGRDAEKLRLYQERNHMEWLRFEQQQIDYVYKLFTNQDTDYVAFTLRSMTITTAYYYLLHWLIVGKKLPEVNIGILAFVLDAPDDDKRFIIEAYIADRMDTQKLTEVIMAVAQKMLQSAKPKPPVPKPATPSVSSYTSSRYSASPKKREPIDWWKVFTSPQCR